MLAPIAIGGGMAVAIRNATAATVSTVGGINSGRLRGRRVLFDILMTGS